MQTYKAQEDFPLGFRCLICADTQGAVAIPKIPSQAPVSCPAHLPDQGGPAGVLLTLPQLNPKEPSPGLVSKQLEQLTSRREGAGLAHGAAETHVKAGRRSKAGMEMFARGNASNSSLMTLPLL